MTKIGSESKFVSIRKNAGFWPEINSGPNISRLDQTYRNATSWNSFGTLKARRPGLAVKYRHFVHSVTFPVQRYPLALPLKHQRQRITKQYYTANIVITAGNIVIIAMNKTNENQSFNLSLMPS